MGAFNGTGTFVRTYDWTTDEGNGIDIDSSRMDTEDDGFATGLSTCITKDGQTTITANIPFNNKKITGLNNGSARTDSIALGQVQDNTYEYLGENGGVADAYTWTPSPTLTAYAAGQKWIVKIGAGDGNTGASTANISALGTRNIVKSDGAGSTTALESGDLLAGGFYELTDSGSNLIVLNPEKPYFNIKNASSILDGDAINNLGLAASVGSNALTIALKTKAGTDPSATDAVKISFRDATLTTGTYNTRTATAAASVVVSSGSTLGTTSAVASNVYVYALDNSGTIELGVSLTRFEDNSIQSSTAEGGVGGADSATVLYSTTARSNVPVRLIAVVTSTQATAGTWATSPSTISTLPVPPLPSITFGTAVSASGSSVDFTGIPFWVKRIVITLLDISTNSTSPLLLQLGNSGGILTSGYTGQARDFSATNTLLTSGFLLAVTQVAAGSYHSHTILTRFSSDHTWACDSISSRNDSAGTTGNSICCGAKDVSTALDRIRITTVGGTATFDAGSINIQYQ